MKLISADFSIAVLVEVLEDEVKIILSEAIVIMEHGGHEFVEANLAIFVHIHALQDKVKFLIGRFDSLLLEGLFDLINS